MTEKTKNYKENGFVGFLSIRQLCTNNVTLPVSAGVYIVLRESDQKPHFLTVGSGGHFKGNNPNLPVSRLEKNYIGESRVVYIGQTSCLKRRFRELLRFGAGSDVGHWGGRALWQLSDHDDLIVAWKPMSEVESKAEKARMLQKFVSVYGKLPFANLKKCHTF